MSGDYIPGFQVCELKDQKILLDPHRLDWTINTQSFNCVDKIDIKKIPGPVGRILIGTETFLLNSFGKTSKWKIETGIHVSKSETDKYVALNLIFLGWTNKNKKGVDKDEIVVDYSFQMLNDMEDETLYARQCQENRKFCLANPALGFNKFLPLSKFSYPQRIINVKFRLSLGIFDYDNMEEHFFLSMNTIENVKIADNAEGDTNSEGSLNEEIEYEVYEPDDLDSLIRDLEYEEESDKVKAIEVEDAEQPVPQLSWDSVSDCDIILKISDEASIRVHSHVLADSSPIFRSRLELCSSAFAKLEKWGNFAVIPLEPITSDIETIETFLKYLYDPNSLCSENLKISQHKPLFQLASFYEVESLKKHSVFGYLSQPYIDWNLQLQHGEKLFEIMKYFAMKPNEISRDEYFHLIRESIWRNVYILREIELFQMFTQQIIHGEASATNTALDAKKFKFQILLERLMFSMQ